jgi:hypothetical protein
LCEIVEEPARNYCITGTHLLWKRTDILATATFACRFVYEVVPVATASSIGEALTCLCEIVEKPARNYCITGTHLLWKRTDILATATFACRFVYEVVPVASASSIDEPLTRLCEIVKEPPWDRCLTRTNNLWKSADIIFAAARLRAALFFAGIGGRKVIGVAFTSSIYKSLACLCEIVEEPARSRCLARTNNLRKSTGILFTAAWLSTALVFAGIGGQKVVTVTSAATVRELLTLLCVSVEIPARNNSFTGSDNLWK